MNRPASPAAAPPKPDSRRIRTREACLDAFIELLLAGDYESITVNAVIARAGVGRSTFYEHFTGKEDLLRARISRPFTWLARCVVEEVEGLPEVLAHFRAQRRLVRRLLSGDTRVMMVRGLAALVEERVERGWPSMFAPMSARLAALAVAELQLGMVSHWLEQNEAECPPEALAKVLSQASRALVANCRGAEG